MKRRLFLKLPATLAGLFAATAAPPAARAGIRVSVEKDDPGYVPDYADNRWEIFLDGKELRGCVITADERLGMVKVIRIPAAPDAKNPDQIETAIRRGLVTIRFNPRQPA